MLHINITIQMCYASKNQYGNDVRFSRIMRPENIVPRFELYCYRILEED